jgi:hypothetical protein
VAPEPASSESSAPVREISVRLGGQAQTSAHHPDRFSVPESIDKGKALSAIESEVAFTGRLVPQKASDETPHGSDTEELATEPVLPESVARGPVRGSFSSMLEAEPAPSVPRGRVASQREPDRPNGNTEQASILSTGNRDSSAGPAQQAADPARSARSEKIAAAPEPASSESSAPVREISVRLGGQAQTSAHLRVVERGGEVLVSVRTGDAQLARDLGSHLGELTHRLDQTGFRTELWRPVSQTSDSEPGRDLRDERSNNGHPDHAKPRDRRDSEEQQGRTPWDWADDLDDSTKLT